jgi:FHS family L-fucose permease-like MFS transporter
VLTTLTILLQNQTGLVCLVGISACMSLMFPTIYGIALDGLREDAKLGSAGLIFAIVGGALMPMGAGWFIDQGSFNLGVITLTGESAAFVLPLASFIVVALFGWLTFRSIKPQSAYPHSLPCPLRKPPYATKKTARQNLRARHQRAAPFTGGPRRV